MKPKILEIEPKQAIYIHVQGPYSELDYGSAYNKLWGYIRRHKLDARTAEHISIFYDDPSIVEAAKQRTDICVTIKGDIQPEGEIKVQTIAGGKYAVFLHVGDYKKLVETYEYIYKTWYTTGEYEFREVPMFEKYLNDPQTTAPDKLETEIYIAIK